MKTKLLTMVAALALVMSLAGIVVAAPKVISSFTITPGTAVIGNIVTFQANFTVATIDTTFRNSLCIYYQDASYDSAFGAAPLVVTASTGDVYSREVQTTVGGSTINCAAIAGFKIIGYSVPNSSLFADGGDSIAFNLTVPAAATTQLFRMRQYNQTPTLVGSFNATLTIQTIGSTVYVANDSATCATNTPCLTGIAALNTALSNVSTGGTVYVLGNYLTDSASSAVLNTAKSVTLDGLNSASIASAAGTCTGAMIQTNAGGASLHLQNLTLDGTCAAGNRSAGVLNTLGTTEIKNSTLKNFTGGSDVAARSAGGTLAVGGSTFIGNQTAMDEAGGTLHAFANNVMTNIGLNAATGIAATDNVKCNYWASYAVSGSGAATQYEKRLGSQVSTYIEGAEPLVLGKASIAGAGSYVLVDLGRSTSNPPFNNGTPAGLGALAADFFVACTSRNNATPGTVSITADNVIPGPSGFVLYQITNTAQCSPSTNTQCWNTANVTSTLQGATLTDPAPFEGHHLISNQVDPTAITLHSLSAESNDLPWTMVLGVIAAMAALLVGALVLRKRANRA